MSKKIRPSAGRMVDDSRWLKDKRGIFRLKNDECTEVDYCLRRREKDGWHKGARVGKRVYA